jgi:hypothetical protein
MQVRRIAIALALSLGCNLFLVGLSVIGGLNRDERSPLSKVIEVLGLPAGLIAWPFARLGHDLNEAVIMSASLIVFNALVAWFGLALLARRCRRVSESVGRRE